MQNFNSPFGYLFLLLVIGYIMTCAYIYFRFYKSLRRQRRSGSSKIIDNLEKIAIVTITLITLFVLIRWTIQLALNGCTNPLFLNITCYDINTLSPLWSSVVLVIGGNAVIFTLVADIRRQDKAKGRWKK